MILICIKIFLARIVDVSLGTIRTILTIKRKTILATLLAFIEVFIWFVIAKEALNIEINTLLIPFSYALGYACGTFIGSFLSNNLINDEIFLQVIIKEENSNIISDIRKKGYKISSINLNKGFDDCSRRLLFIQTKRKYINDISHYIQNNTNSSFMLVNEVQKINK